MATISRQFDKKTVEIIHDNTVNSITIHIMCEEKKFEKVMNSEKMRQVCPTSKFDSKSTFLILKSWLNSKNAEKDIKIEEQQARIITSEMGPFYITLSLVESEIEKKFAAKIENLINEKTKQDEKKREKRKKKKEREKEKKKVEKKEKNEVVEKISGIEKKIAKYYYDNNIGNACLSQNNLVYRYILKLNKKAILVKGYLIYTQLKSYCSHCWVEYDGKIIDAAATTTSLVLIDKGYLDDKYHDKIYSHTRPRGEYECKDDIDEKEIDSAHQRCLDGKYMDDMKNKADKKIYKLTKKIYDEILK